MDLVPTNIIKIVLAVGTCIGAFTSLTYTGEAQIPSATVTIDGLTVTGLWSSVTNVSDTSTFTPDDDNFTGTVSAQVNGMSGKPMTDKETTITGVDASYIFTNTAITPTPVVKDGETTLVEGTDYSVSYANNTAVSTNDTKATVIITFKGNYSGEVTTTFEIAYGIAEDSMVSIPEATSGWYSSGVVVTADGKIYEASYTYNLDTSSPTVEITVLETTWSKILTAITFGLYSTNEEVETIKGTDTLSGVALVQYYIANEAIDYTSITEWTTYTSSFKLEKDGAYVVYAKVTDNVGNSTIINSDGLVIYTKSTVKDASVTGNTEATVDNEVLNQLLAELFTEEEVALGAEMKVEVKVDIVLVDNMDEDAQGEFDTYLEEYNVGLEDSAKATQALVFDISVIKSLAGVEENITTLDTPITITIKIPEEYQAEGREFFILRSHDGEITILEDLDDDPTTITISTDCFSNYTLNYVEVEEDTDTAPNTDTATAPNTGDHSMPQMLLALMLVSLLGMVVAIKKRVVK